MSEFELPRNYAINCFSLFLITLTALSVVLILVREVNYGVGLSWDPITQLVPL